jgi:hypothetical protein
MSVRSLLLCSVTALSLLVSPAIAGPFRDTEAAILEAYADYRTALFQTNQNNRPASDAAIGSFRAKWLALTRQWITTPPPQYSDDPEFGKTVGVINQLADDAASASSVGDLTKAHNILEGIRHALGELRARNGVVSFSDKMNAYHAHMEHVLEQTSSSPALVAEDAAILAFLIRDMEKQRPHGVDPLAFDQALKAVGASVEALRQAVKTGDPLVIETARKALKGPYSRMFLRFG